ncbi:MAG: hypothetical protein P8179_20155 [Candidatus Thiodiazotropha sp.]
MPSKSTTRVLPDQWRQHIEDWRSGLAQLMNKTASLLSGSESQLLPISLLAKKAGTCDG